MLHGRGCRGGGSPSDTGSMKVSNPGRRWLSVVVAVALCACPVGPARAEVATPPVRLDVVGLSLDNTPPDLARRFNIVSGMKISLLVRAEKPVVQVVVKNFRLGACTDDVGTDLRAQSRPDVATRTFRRAQPDEADELTCVELSTARLPAPAARRVLGEGTCDLELVTRRATLDTGPNDFSQPAEVVAGDRRIRISAEKAGESRLVFRLKYKGRPDLISTVKFVGSDGRELAGSLIDTRRDYGPGATRDENRITCEDAYTFSPAVGTQGSLRITYNADIESVSADFKFVTALTLGEQNVALNVHPKPAEGKGASLPGGGAISAPVSP